MLFVSSGQMYTMRQNVLNTAKYLIYGCGLKKFSEILGGWSLLSPLWMQLWVCGGKHRMQNIFYFLIRYFITWLQKCVYLFRCALLKKYVYVIVAIVSIGVWNGIDREEFIIIRNNHRVLTYVVCLFVCVSGLKYYTDWSGQLKSRSTDWSFYRGLLDVPSFYFKTTYQMQRLHTLTRTAFIMKTPVSSSIFLHLHGRKTVIFTDDFDHTDWV